VKSEDGGFCGHRKKYMKIRAIKLFVCPLFFVFAASAYCGAIDFINQNVVNSSWQYVSSASSGVFYGGYTVYIPAERTGLSGNVILASNDGSTRILNSSGTHRFLSFSAANSSLAASNITFYGGRYNGMNTAGGGAVYSGASGLTISGSSVIFNQNRSETSSGGAIYLAAGTLTLGGSVTFNNNTAQTGYGGAAYSGGNIISLAGSRLEINTSTSSYGGGAFYAASGYIEIRGGAVINGNRTISDQVDINGGAFFASSYILFGSAAETISITSNQTQRFGGALYSGSYVTFNGGAKIDSNKATTGTSTSTARGGGAIYAVGSVTFASSTAAIELTNNTATGNGGAIYSNASVIFSGSSLIDRNSTDTSGPASDGGAIWADSGINFTNVSSTATITSNTAKAGNGGALYSNTGIIFSGYVNATGNTAEKGYGGFSVSSSIAVRDGGEFVFNTAASSGGAIFIQNGNGVWTSSISARPKDVVFRDNTAGGKRNDIHMAGNGRLNFYADSGRNITLDGGITSGGTGNLVVKEGRGNLVLNGDFYMQDFNVNAGAVMLGNTAVFETGNAVFASSTVFDLRNNNNTDIVRISSNITSSALIYYDFDSDSNASDLIVANSANMAGTTIKVGVAGIDSSTRTYNVIKTTADSSGSINIDKTNSQGNDMSRVSADFVYYSGNSSGTSLAAWDRADLNVHINQLNVMKELTGNQLKVALALDRDYGTATDDLFNIIDTIDDLPSEPEKKSALNDISGHIYANAVTLSALNASKNNILSRLKKSYFIADDSVLKRNVWIQGYGALNSYRGDDDSPGDFSASNSGFLAGFDTLKDEKHIFGISAGYVGTDAEQNGDKISIDGYSIGGYGSYFFENNFEAKFMVMGGRQNYASSRDIRYLNRTTKASFVGYSLNLSAEAGYDYYYKNNVYFRPFAGLDYSFVATNEFSETGVNFSTSAADLTIYSGSYNRVNTALGIQINNGTQMRLKWYGEIKADLLLLGRAGEFAGKFKNSEHELEIKGITNDVFNFGIGAGALYDISSSFSAYANISCSFSGTQTGFYGNLGLNYKFSTEIIGFYDR
jgi:predicted outer membrane repeat protein